MRNIKTQSKSLHISTNVHIQVCLIPSQQRCKQLLNKGPFRSYLYSHESKTKSIKANTACALDALTQTTEKTLQAFFLISYRLCCYLSGGRNKRLLGLESEIEVRTKETLTLEVKVTHDAVLVTVTEILNYEC